jgi:predicted unusual protein kinase regulating ubiquinone biosynthesis (AarF/ABC1/UbiB family)
VAVKVQYPWLEDSLESDLQVSRTALRAWLRWRGGPRAEIDPERIFDEFAHGLIEELDFEREAVVAAEIARNLASEARIVVPEVVPSHSTRRVLTMTYHPQVALTDPRALRDAGIEPREVLEIVGRAYAKQIFVDGLFHADPHPGNLYATDPAEPGGPARVLFVDFGLSKRLTPELRLELRRGMYALLQRDADGFLAGMDRMGMIAPGAREGVRRAVERMLGRLAAGEGGALGLAGSRVLGLKDEAKALLQDTPGLTLPNDLLLYAKTLSYLFALGDRIAPDVDLMKLSLPYVLRFLAERDAEEDERV